MGEYGPSAILGIFKTLSASEPDVRNGGIVGDRRHGTGYHRSRNALRAAGRYSDYSIQDARDKAGDGNAASALDLTPRTQALQHKLTARLIAAMKARDPRVVGKLREFGGSLDSKVVTAYRVEDQKRISFDSSHLWHVHLSIFRKYANDVSVCQGIAEVLAGKDAKPYVWDGKSFPGAERFYIGAKGAWVTRLGQMLVKAGFKGYSVGPGPEFSSVDRDGVAWFQRKQGWSGSDADGYPGSETWARLTALYDEKPTPTPPKPPTPTEGTYTVLPGDTYISIAAKLGVPDWHVIEKLNGTPPTELKIGQVLKIPAPVKPVEKTYAFWIAQLNVQKASWRKAGDQSWSKSLPQIVSKIKGARASIVILNECDSAAAAQIQARLGKQWEWDRVGVNCVFRDKEKWAQVGKVLEWTLAGNGTRTLVGVNLRRTDVPGAVPIFVGSTHFEALASGYARDAADAQRLRDAQARDVVKAAPKSGPAIIGGDFNDADVTSGPPKILADEGVLPLGGRAWVGSEG